MNADEAIREAARADNPAAHLRQLGWTLLPPKEPRERRPLESYVRDEYLEAASRNGWRGGSSAKGFLSAAEIAECDARARAKREADADNPYYRKPAV